MGRQATVRGFCAALCLLTLAAHAERARVVVVKSQDLAAYTSVVAGFSAEAKADVEEVILGEGDAAARSTFEKLAAARPAMVLAIGPAAANGAKRALAGVPVVFCMVPYYEKYGLEGPNVTGIALTSDLNMELATLKAVAPATRRVGILMDRRYSEKLIEDAAEAAAKEGMSIVPLDLEGAGKAEKVLKAARGKLDAMVMIADKTVGNAAVVRALIAHCEAEKIPLVALSASQVKEGAMLSLSPSSTGIGQQAGRLANRIIHEKVDPGALAVAQPEVLDLAMNLTTARKLGSSCELALEILKFAARTGCPMKVFE